MSVYIHTDIVVYVSYELTAINSVDSSTGLHTFHIFHTTGIYP